MCTKPETFFLFCGYKNVHSLQSTQHGSFTNQADELHRQANEIKHPSSYKSCYETMMEKQQLLSKAREMESAARDIQTQMKEIAASGLTIPSSTLLRKAIISVKNGKVMFCIEQLSKVVNLFMGNLPHILFRPKSDTKEYVILLFWSINMDNSECKIQKKIRNYQARNRCRSLSTSLCCGKRTVSETSISILAKQLRVFESAKRRSLPPAAGQQGTTKQLSPTPQESWTETKTCKHALMYIILLIKYNTINVVIIKTRDRTIVFS